MAVDQGTEHANLVGAVHAGIHAVGHHTRGALGGVTAARVEAVGAAAVAAKAACLLSGLEEGRRLVDALCAESRWRAVHARAVVCGENSG